VEQEKVEAGIKFIKSELDKGKSLKQCLNELKGTCSEKELEEIRKQFDYRSGKAGSEMILKQLITTPDKGPADISNGCFSGFIFCLRGLSVTVSILTTQKIRCLYTAVSGFFTLTERKNPRLKAWVFYTT